MAHPLVEANTERPAALPPKRRFITDQSWWRFVSPRGDTVMAGSPLRLFRFAPGARQLLENLETGETLDTATLPPGGDRVLDRLLQADAIHRRVDDDFAPAIQFDPSDITVVIPSRDDDRDSLARLIGSLPPVPRVVIVDDGSIEPIEHFDCDHIAEILVHRLPQSCGPAAARNIGSSLVDTPLVCFVDSDIELPDDIREPSSWVPLLVHFDDPRLCLVAPRVQSSSGSTVLERYEMTDSPLDMGRHPARLHPQGRLSYVPSAMMLVRTDALRRIGGFDETLRYGEDVDLVWRLMESASAGDRTVCRYEPAMTVHHRPRSTWSAWARQRFLYGTSAAHLDARHPGSLAPLRLQSWTAAAWSSGVAGRSILALIITAISGFRLRRSLPVPSGSAAEGRAGHDFERDIIAARVILRGQALAGQAVARATTRTWWPIMALGSVGSRRVRRLWLVAMIVPALWQWKQRDSDLDPARYTAARILDDLSYGAGVWSEALKMRRFGPLRPDVH